MRLDLEFVPGDEVGVLLLSRRKPRFSGHFQQPAHRETLAMIEAVASRLGPTLSVVRVFETTGWVN